MIGYTSIDVSFDMLDRTRTDWSQIEVCPYWNAGEIDPMFARSQCEEMLQSAVPVQTAEWSLTAHLC